MASLESVFGLDESQSAVWPHQSSLFSGVRVKWPTGHVVRRSAAEIKSQQQTSALQHVTLDVNHTDYGNCRCMGQAALPPSRIAAPQ